MGPPAANNRLNNPPSHPQTHPGRALSSFLKEERGANENYRGPRAHHHLHRQHSDGMSATLSRATPPVTTCQGGPTTLPTASATLRREETNQGGIGGREDHRGESALCPLISHLSRPFLNLVQIWSEAVLLSSTTTPLLSNLHWLLDTLSPPISSFAFLFPPNLLRSIVTNHHPLSSFHCGWIRLDWMVYFDHLCYQIDYHLHLILHRGRGRGNRIKICCATL